MAGYTGSVGLTGYVAPKDTLDTYAIQDEAFNRGGYRSVANITERDAITADRRKLGMLVYCFSDSTYYTLKNGLTNADWEVAVFTGGKFIDLSDTPNNYTSPAMSLPMLYADQTNNEIFYAGYTNFTIRYKQAQTTPQELDQMFGVIELEAFTKASGHGVAEFYLPYINYYNRFLQGRILYIKHRYDSVSDPAEDVRILPHPDAGGAGDDPDNLYDSKGSAIASVTLKPGETGVFLSDNDDPQSWCFLGLIGGGSGSTSTENWEDIPSDSSVNLSGKYFLYGGSRLTLTSNATNREFEIKSVSGGIVETDTNIIDGTNQSINLNAGSAIKILAKEDDTYWIISKY